MPRSVVIAFYGHTAESAKGATGNPEYQFLSNFSRCQFSLDGNTFYSTEQWLHWSKAHLFKDKMIANKILSLLNEDDLESDNTNWTNKNKKIKALGRKVAKFDAERWDASKFEIMKKGLYAKFSQDEGLKQILLSTSHNTLAEASANDKIWGIGLSTKSPAVKDKSKWKGQNLLGRALMQVRKALRSE